MNRILICSLSLLLLATTANASGCFIWNNEIVDIRQPQQKALIVFDEGIEDLVLEVQFEGAVEDFAWLVPLPAAPEIKVVEPETFEMLDMATKTLYLGGSTRAGDISTDKPGTEVSVLDRRMVGICDIAVLQGGAGGGLVAWLAEHGFRIPAHATPVIDRYLARNWVFAAMRISPTASIPDAPQVEFVAEGSTQPVLFRFACDEPVYPLQISSITGNPVDILLYVIAETPLVCRNKVDVDWRVGLLGQVDLDAFEISDHQAYYAGTSVRRDTTYYATGIAERFFTDRGGAALTKLRATFSPQQMEDLVFESYSAIDELASEDLIRRVNAANYLGIHPFREAVVPLLEMIWRSNADAIDQEDALQFFWGEGYYPDQDVVSALSTLGRMGAVEAEEEVARWAGGANPRCALAALKALQGIAPQSVTDVCLEILSGSRSHLERCDEEVAMIDFSRDWLIAHGGPELAPALGDIVSAQYAAKAWDEYNFKRPDLGISALLAAAACGNEPAQAELSSNMKRVAIDLGAPSSEASGRRGGLVNNYPAAMSLGAAIIFSGYGTHGAPLKLVQEHLSVRPALKESLFRQLAYDPDLGSATDGRRAAMLSKLETLDDNDVGLLREIWDHALAQPRKMGVVFRGSPAANDTVIYNVDAAAAAYAMGIRGRVSDLLDCWRDVSWDDVDMKGELALALSLTDDPAGAPAVLEYIRTVWNRNAAAPSMAAAVGVIPPPPYDWPVNAPLDLRYRVSGIRDFVIEHAWDEIIAMAGDESLSPLLRTYWVLDSSIWWQNPTDRYVELLRELRSLNEIEFLEQRIDWKIDHAVRTLALLRSE